MADGYTRRNNHCWCTRVSGQLPLVSTGGSNMTDQERNLSLTAATKTVTHRNLYKPTKMWDYSDQSFKTSLRNTKDWTWKGYLVLGLDGYQENVNSVNRFCHQIEEGLNCSTTKKREKKVCVCVCVCIKPLVRGNKYDYMVHPQEDKWGVLKGWE